MVAKRDGQARAFSCLSRYHAGCGVREYVRLLTILDDMILQNENKMKK
jgi:hypothetical protein